MKQSHSQHKLNAILEKATQEECLERDEIVFLLGLTQQKHIDDVFSVARGIEAPAFWQPGFPLRVYIYQYVLSQPVQFLLLSKCQ